MCSALLTSLSSFDVLQESNARPIRVNNLLRTASSEHVFRLHSWPLEFLSLVAQCIQLLRILCCQLQIVVSISTVLYIFIPGYSINKVFLMHNGRNMVMCAVIPLMCKKNVHHFHLLEACSLLNIF